MAFDLVDTAVLAVAVLAVAVLAVAVYYSAVSFVYHSAVAEEELVYYSVVV